MSYSARIELDSINQFGNRLTTFVVTYPRFIHSEMLTHRVFSRNSSSSRAIPTQKLIEQVGDDPVRPIYWGKNQPGMQAEAELSPSVKNQAVAEWLEARDCALAHAKRLHKLGAHKQLVNRILEPWSWISVIITATEYENFFQLRCSPDAQPEIQHIALQMQSIYGESIPQELNLGEWHLPFVGDDERSPKALDLSAARCARVSYLTHDGEHDPEKDIRLAKRLNESGHMSPFEHQATPAKYPVGSILGNFKGWHQYRHLVQSISGC